MIKKLALGVLRRIHNLVRPVTRRVADRLRFLMRESMAPLEAQIADLSRRVDSESAGKQQLSDQLDALELAVRTREDSTLVRTDGIFAKTESMLAGIESLDFKLLKLARAVHEIDAALALQATGVAELAEAAKMAEAALALQATGVAELAEAAKLAEASKMVETTETLDPASHVSTAALDRNIEFIKSRISSYAGKDVVLTYLKDESPIFVNTGDLGCPSPIIDGGVWEPENTEILRSFITASTKFLDIGANVGYFSIVVGKRLEKGKGRVIAIEPHPRMVELIERSVQLNHLEPVIEVHRIAASDREGEIKLFYPDGHIGQGSSVRHFDTPGQSVQARARRLDDLLPTDMEVDLVKIDVEGAEPAVLRGMEGIIRRSPDIKILFEKLAGHAETEPDGTIDFFTRMGFKLYGVGPGASLFPLDTRQYAEMVGDVVAAREGVIDALDRARFSVYPGQLVGSGQRDNEGTLYRTTGGGILFFGPYWTLPAGSWSFRLTGTIEGAVRLVVGGSDPALSFQFELASDSLEGKFFTPRDLHQFELRAYGDDGTSVHLRQVDFFRLGG